MTTTLSSSSTAPALRTAIKAIGWTGLGIIGIAVSLSDFLVQAPAGAQGDAGLLLPPSPQFLFGTDMLGRDIAAETLHALTQTVGLCLIGMTVALVAGSLAGFLTARIPIAISLICRWVMGVLASVPALLLAVLAIGIWSRDFSAIAVGLAAAPIGFVRAFDHARAQEKTAYAEYARATGITASALLRRDLVYEFRNAIFPTAARALASVAITLSTVSFLGFGAVPPHRDLGLMIAASRSTFLDQWWTAFFPILTLTLLILCARLAAGLEEGERP